MQRRAFIKTVGRAVGAGAAAGVLGACDPAPERRPMVTSRPNIVFFLIDDQRDDTLGCAGHPIVKTPVVDGLARRGVRFRNTFVTTSICAASRASIFTGLVERTHGYTFGKPPVPARFIETSYPALLRAAGYRTGFVGKYGIKAEGEEEAEARMFDFCRKIHQPFFKEQPDGTLRHETELCGDAGVEFLRATPEGTPFCLSISFNATHAADGDKRPGVGHYPWPKAVDGMYEDIDIPPPRLADPAIFEALPEFLRKSMNRDRWFWRWDTPEKYATNMRAYFRMISGVDRVIGRMMSELESLGVAGNTVVIYLADNGYYMGDRGFAGKWSHYEQSLRVPLVIHDPRPGASRRGAVEDRMALNTDMAATMLDLAGVDVPAVHQGRSLVPLIKEAGEAGEWRSDFFCEHLMDNASIPKWEGVRSERLKYARYFEQQPSYEFLHDLEADPDELTNLAADPAHSDTLARLRRRTDELRDGYASV
jgi:arylsulfatase A-like enzyme